jgi:hypothetical protein
MFKPSVLAADQHVAATALRNCRLFSVFGTWHDIKIAVTRRVCVCKKCGSNDWVHDRQMQYTRTWESTA